jgi:hypothetical protein
MASTLERRSITTALPLSAVDPGSGSGTTNSRISAGRHQRHGIRFRLWKRRIATASRIAYSPYLGFRQVEPNT